MMKIEGECRAFREAMPDLLLDGASGGGAHSQDDGMARTSIWSRHLAACAACSTEWHDLRATWSALDAWEAPEPSAYFDTRLHARLRDALADRPESWIERMRSYVLFSTGRSLRPALAGALALVMLAGGGSGLGLLGLHHRLAAANQADSHTLNDLKVLDNNAQALQEMGQLLDDNGGDEDAGSPTT